MPSESSREEYTSSAFLAVSGACVLWLLAPLALLKALTPVPSTMAFSPDSGPTTPSCKDPCGHIRSTQIAAVINLSLDVKQNHICRDSCAI